MILVGMAIIVILMVAMFLYFQTMGNNFLFTN